MAHLKQTSCRFLIELIPYSRHLYVSLGESDARLKAGLTRLMSSSRVEEWVELIGPQQPAEDGKTAFIQGSGIVLRLRDYPTDARQYGVLAHEVFHAVEYLFASVGLPHEAQTSSEAWAYMIGYIHQQIYNQLWE